MPRFRLLPVLMVFLIVLFGAKMFDVATGVKNMNHMMANPAVAEEKKEAVKTESQKEAEATGDKELPQDHGAKQANEKAEETAAAEFENPALTKDAEKAKQGMAKEFSQVEIDLLQNLSQRRLELEKLEGEVKLKENMLKATEERLNAKFTDMKALKEELSRLLVGYEKEEDAKIKSLVKIYENMKPKDAARIFEQLDMPVLLLVADRMSERKIAPIFASMTPERAKQLTIELAESQKVKEKFDAPADEAAIAPLP